MDNAIFTLEELPDSRMRASRLRSLPLLPLGVLYICAHMVLDWLSYVHPFGSFGLTPWNPSTGLGFVMVLLLGRRTLPLFFAALIISIFFYRGGAVRDLLAIVERRPSRTTSTGLQWV